MCHQPQSSGALLGALTKTNARPITMRVIYAVKARPGVAIPSSRWFQAEAHHQGKRMPWARGVGPVPGSGTLVPGVLVPDVLPGQGRFGGLPGEPGPGITAVTPKSIRQRATLGD